MNETGAYEQSPTQEEIAQAVNVLKKLEPGFLPLDIFLETSRLCTTPIVELVPLRRNGERSEVLLFRRPTDDPNWPNLLHTPGTVVRPDDVGMGLQGPLERLYSDELQSKPAAEPVLVGPVLHQVTRGAEFATVLYVDMQGTEVTVGEWHPAHALPSDLVSTQQEFIAEAVRAFERNQNS